MTGAPDGPLRGWAAAHAATVLAPALSAAGPPVAAGRPVPPPTADYTRATPDPSANRPGSIGGHRPIRLRSVRPLWERDGLSTNIGSLALGRGPDGHIKVAVGREDGIVHLFDAMTGDQEQTLGEPAGRAALDMERVAWGYRGDGRALVAAIGTDGDARVWDPSSGELLCVMPRHWGVGGFACLAWRSGAGGPSLLAVGGSNDAQVEIWDPEARVRVREFPTSGPAASFAWLTHADGRELLLINVHAEEDDVTRPEIWDPSTGRLLAVFEEDELGWNAALRQDPDGRLLLATSTVDGAMVRLLDQDLGHEATAICPGRQTTAVAWAPLRDGRALLATTSPEGLRLWDGRTGRCLHSEPISFPAYGLQHLDWMPTADGTLLLAADGSDGLHVLEVVLEAPAQPAGTPQQPGTAGEQAPPGRLLLPPAEITPDFPAAAALRETTYELDVVNGADGGTRVVSHGSTRSAQLWDLASGRHLRAVGTRGGTMVEASLARARDGRLLLATAEALFARVWDADTGQQLHALSGYRHFNSVAWKQARDGRLLLAADDGETTMVWDADTRRSLVAAEHDGLIQCSVWTPASDPRSLFASTDYATTKIWDADTGQQLHTLVEDSPFTAALAWTRASDTRRILATARRGNAQLWDADSGRCLHTLALDDDDAYIHSLAWALASNGRLLLATATRGQAQVWDAETGQCLRTFTGDAARVHETSEDPEAFTTAVWSPTADGRLLLAVSELRSGRIWIWDAEAGTEIALLNGPSPLLSQAIRWHRDARGNLLLLAVNREVSPGPFRAWLVEAGPEAAVPDERERPGRGRAACRLRMLAADSGGRLLRLGAGDLWPPLGLVADLLTLTGADGGGREPAADYEQPEITALCDSRLRALAAEAGVARLRELAGGEPRWSPDARAAFAALLAHSLRVPDEYKPPAGADPARLAGALAGALAAPAGAVPAGVAPAAPWRPPVADLQAASAAITEQVIALLAILGPDACAADPLLPVRLAHRAPHLPALSAHELRLLAAASGPPASATATTTGIMSWSPGTAGVTRDGPPNRLLATQLALPHGLLTARLAEGQLLYRQHRAPTPPTPDPVTIILDTTPPTFGPAGNALRLAAHLVTTTLWQYGRYPALVTLTDPARVVELRTPADLISLWASATLSDPGCCLATARQTASQLGQPVICCTHFLVARDDGYLPRPGGRLLTAHQPPEDPPAGLLSPWHAHLPPNPTQATLASAAAQLIMAGAP